MRSMRLDPLGVGADEVRARGDPGVVDEQVEPRMAARARARPPPRPARGRRRRTPRARRASAAGVRERPTTCQPRACERPTELGADAGGGSRDDRDAHPRSTLAHGG